MTKKTETEKTIDNTLALVKDGLFLVVIVIATSFFTYKITDTSNNNEVKNLKATVLDLRLKNNELTSSSSSNDNRETLIIEKHKRALSDVYDSASVIMANCSVLDKETCSIAANMWKTNIKHTYNIK